MKTLNMVITSNGDGSNSIQFVVDPAVLDKMIELADDGDEYYASGDGLQVKTLQFKDDFDLESWMKLNYISLTTINDIKTQCELYGY